MTFQELADEMMQLYAQGDYAGALALVEQQAGLFPEHAGRTTFWKMCLLSLCGRADDVMAIFQRGLDPGLWWADRQFTDPDLDAVRDLPEFRRLMEISLETYRQAQQYIKPERVLLEPDPYESTVPLLIALHGGGGNKDLSHDQWDVARRLGWLVLIPQSTHSIFPNAYWWAEDLSRRLDDIQIHVDEVMQNYPIDTSRVVTTGISQGSGMAIYSALSARFPIRGFISVAIGWPDTTGIAELAAHTSDVRGYFVIGEKDRALHNAREIQNILRQNNISIEEEVHAHLGHQFPPDFESSFQNAIKFIFKEQE